MADSGSKSEPTRPRQVSNDKYLIPVACKTLDILEAFHSPQELLTLEQVIARTGIAHTTAFRILHTLVSRNYLLVAGPGKRYRLNQVRRRAKLGFATLTSQTSFANNVTESLKRAARDAGLELVLFNNERSGEVAVKNAQSMVSSGVDVAIEFQRHEQFAPVIADIFTVANIPTVAVLIPQPGAIYFGVNNYRAGLTAGQALADHAIQHWKKRINLLLLLDLPAGGPVLQSRMTGVLRGLEERLGPIPASKIMRVDGKGTQRESAAAVRDALSDIGDANRILVSAVNDESALGALEVIRELGFGDVSAIVGHGGSSEVWPEIADASSPFIGTTYFFPEQYGQGLVNLAMRIMRGESVPPYNYVPHELVHAGNLQAFVRH